MIQNNKVLVVITARGGSKGLPKKNIKLLHGKPLISWTIGAALKSKYVDRVVVSTDSSEIGDISREAGAEVPFLRPEELAGDTSKQEDAILHAIECLEKHESNFSILVVLCPTNPLRDAVEIDRCIEELLANPAAEAIFTVMKCEHSPLQANVLPLDRSLANFISDDLKFLNRQELPTYFQLSGSVAVAYSNYFRREKSFLGSKTFASITSQRKGLDINTLRDFLLAEIYMKNPGLE